MTGTIPLSEFWRVGRKADPLHIDIRFQGAGRFDDPERLVPVLYGAPSLRTCLLEFLLPWSRSSQSREIVQSIPIPTTEEEEADAANDRQIAEQQWRIPPTLYERAAIHVLAEPPISLLDLREVGVRNRFRNVDKILRELRSTGFTQLDRGALLSPNRTLTQTITGAILRGPLSSETIGGLLAESRHAGDIIVVFSGEPYQPHLRIIENVSLTNDNVDVISVAKELDLSI